MTSGASTVNFAYDSMGNLIELSQLNSIEGYSFTMSNQYTYTNDRVTSITHNGFSYNFTYDEWGNQLTVSVGEHQLVGYEYDYANDDRLTKINYANGQSETYTYDTGGNITAISHDNGATATYAFTYDADGVLTTVTDNRCGLVTIYSDSGTQIRTTDNELVYSSVYNEDGSQTENVLGNAITYTYNSEYNQVTGKTVSTKAFSNSTVVTENEIEYSISSDVDISVTTDWFGRTEKKTIDVDTLKTTVETEETSEYSVVGEYNFTYADTDTTASTKITSHSLSFVSSEITNNRTDYYEYDAQGNITTISRYVEVDGEQVLIPYYHYEYDEAGQLVREDIYEQFKTITYSYDAGGNICSKKEYDLAIGSEDEETLSFLKITGDMTPNAVYSYTYEQNGWNDKLTNFTHTEGTKQKINTEITYDASGNVTSFNSLEYTWTAGRQLASATTDEDGLCRYYYNENGFLTQIDIYETDKTSPVSKYLYIWDNDKLIARQVVSYEPQDNGLIMTSRIIYDADDEPQGFILQQEQNGISGMSATFLYRKNLQGDITGVIDSLSGKILVEYIYDAYGNPQVITDGSIESAIISIVITAYNPLLYRGYIYTNLGGEFSYYLGSRFYIPQLGRFLNADKYTDTGTGVIGTNMFAYCNNNPVMFVDPSGEWGKDVHSGIKEKRIKRIKYNGIYYKYGTYHWATEFVGIEDANAKIIAKSCYFVDLVFPAVIPSKKYQSWHFDTLNGPGDSRDLVSSICITLAMSSFEQAKVNPKEYSDYIFKGLVYLGAALHPLQDKYSHTAKVSINFGLFYSHAHIPNVDNASVHASVVLGIVQTKTIDVIASVYYRYKELIDDYLFYYPDSTIKKELRKIQI